MPHNTAIYVRVSKNVQKSREAQIEECLKWMSQKGWAGGTVYSEAASTLRGDKRPEYAKCKENIKRGHHDGLIVWSLNRWGRNFYQLIRDLDLFRRIKVPFTSASQGFSTDTAAGRTNAHLIAVIAEAERDIRAENVSMGVRYAVNQDERKRGGRPRTVESATIARYVKSGNTWSEAAKFYKVSMATVARAVRKGKAAKAEASALRREERQEEEFPCEE